MKNLDSKDESPSKKKRQEVFERKHEELARLRASQVLNVPTTTPIKTEQQEATSSHPQTPKAKDQPDSEDLTLPFYATGNNLIGTVTSEVKSPLT